MLRFSKKFFLEWTFLVCCSINTLCFPKTKEVPLPDSLILELNIDENLKVKLDLQKESDSLKENNIVSASYNDPLFKALVTVTRDDVGSLTYIGSFYLKKQEYSIHPKDYPNKLLEDKILKKYELVINNDKYIVSALKTQKSIDLSDDDVSDVLFNGESFEEAFEKVSFHDNITRNKSEAFQGVISNQRNTKRELCVELMLVIDYSIYKEWLGYTKGNEKEAIEHIKYYYTHITNGVDDRYRRIEHQAFSIKVVVVGLFIAKQESDAPFTKTPDLRRNNVLYVEGSLVTLNKWTLQSIKQGKFKRLDAVLMIHRYETGGKVGVANKKSVCSKGAVGMIQKQDSHGNIFTATHELGHMLGSDHDGDKNKCDMRKMNIMTPHTISNTNKYENELFFSKCSIAFISSLINYLDKINKNCLLNKPNMDEKVLNQDKYGVVMPGQKFDLNQQCQTRYGSTSYYCADSSKGDKLCKNVDCFDPLWRECSGNRYNRAMDGTHCSNGSWCIRGRCVPSKQAPMTDVEKCKYGEYKGRLPERSLNIKCSDLSKTQYKHLCYTHHEKCCKFCVKTTRKPECLYGDKQQSCTTTYCYDEKYRKKCCSTCK